MFLVANFISALAICLDIVTSVLWWLVIIRALLSWVSPDPFNPIVQILNNVTEPLLAPFRKIVPAYNIGIDISPIFVLLILLFIKYFIVKSLLELATRLK